MAIEQVAAVCWQLQMNHAAARVMMVTIEFTGQFALQIKAGRIAELLDKLDTALQEILLIAVCRQQMLRTDTDCDVFTN